jgi:hypothetical protein
MSLKARRVPPPLPGRSLPFLRPAVIADLPLHASEPYNTRMACLVATRRRPIVFQSPEDPRQRPKLALRGGYIWRLNMWFRHYRADLVALLVVTIWGISAPFCKAALAEFDVLPFTALRFLGMLVLSLPPCRSGHSDSKRLGAPSCSAYASHCWVWWSLSGRRLSSVNSASLGDLISLAAALGFAVELTHEVAADRHASAARLASTLAICASTSAKRSRSFCTTAGLALRRKSSLASLRCAKAMRSRS